MSDTSAAGEWKQAVERLRNWIDETGYESDPIQRDAILVCEELTRCKTATTAIFGDELEVALSSLATAQQERDEARRILTEVTVDEQSLRGLKIEWHEDDKRHYAYDSKGNLKWTGDPTFNVWRCVRFDDERKELLARAEAAEAACRDKDEIVKDALEAMGHVEYSDWWQSLSKALKVQPNASALQTGGE